MPNYTCIICGHQTIPSRTDWEICPVCFWEDDVPYFEKDCSSPANGMTIKEAQQNFILYGACSKRYLEHVRNALDSEPFDSEWKTLQ